MRRVSIIIAVCAVLALAVGLIGQGRDAADVPITHTFGPNTLSSFKVWTDLIS